MRGRQLIVIAIAVSMLGIGVVVGRLTDAGSPTEATVPPSRTPAPTFSPRSRPPAPTFSPRSRPPSTPPPARRPGGEAPRASGSALGARARSVQTSLYGTVQRTRMRLSGDVRFTAGLVDVTDARGRSFDSTHLEGASRSIRIEGEVRVSGGGLTITPDRVEIGPHPLAYLDIEVVDRVVITGKGLSVREGAEDVNLISPVTVTSFISGSDWDLTLSRTARWHGGPTRVSGAGSGFVSWDGDGSITKGRIRSTARYLGAVGDLSVSVRRDGSSVRVEGDGTITQIFENGRCILDTDADLLLRSRKRVARRAGHSFEIRQAPSNDGKSLMCIERIHGASAAASWVRVALEPLPPMVGGTAREAVGGRSTGVDDEERCFFVCSPIPLASIIRPGQADERSLTVIVPERARAGPHEVTLELRGNFPTVRLTVTVEVRR